MNATRRRLRQRPGRHALQCPRHVRNEVVLTVHDGALDYVLFYALDDVPGVFVRPTRQGGHPPRQIHGGGLHCVRGEVLLGVHTVSLSLAA